MIYDMNPRASVIFGDSINEVAEWLAATRVSWKKQCSKTNKASPSWDRGVGYEGAWRLARDGWSEGAALLDTEAFSANGQAMAKQNVIDFAGHLPDIGRFCAGEPMHMVRHKRKDRPTVHLVVNISASAAVSADAFIKYGRGVMAVIDNLEKSGMRVELDAGFCATLCNSSRSKVFVGWKVKRAADALDLGALAFTVAHPAAMRRICFAMCERLPLSYEDHGAYGYPTTDISPFMARIDAEDAHTLPGIGISTGMTVKEAEAHLMNDLRKVGLVSEGTHYD